MGGFNPIDPDKGGNVPSGAPTGDYVGGGAEYAGTDDADADDLPMTGNGTTDGHADCVPAASGGWPAVKS